ncbi:MAG: hypothetical protein U0414_31715 [Polyangiaceae bacterium]
MAIGPLIEQAHPTDAENSATKPRWERRRLDLVDDVDAAYARLEDVAPLVHELTTMPWGNRTFQLRDPEGTAVSLYTPVTDAAKQRFSKR